MRRRRVPGPWPQATGLLGTPGLAGSPAPEDQEWHAATVVDWLEDRGYGFLELPDGRRVYVHHSSFGGGSLLQGGSCEVVVAADRLNPGKWRAASLRGPAIVARVGGDDDDASAAKRTRRM